MSQKPTEAARKGGIHPNTPQFFFWMKFLEREPDLRSDFHWRVSNGDGFINWDFLPGKGKIARLHKCTQYRIALDDVQKSIEVLGSDTANMNSNYLTEMIAYLTCLKELTDQILAIRGKNINYHDTLPNRIKESFSAKNPIKSHKQVYQIWMEIRDAIISRIEVLTNEKQHRERLVGIQQEEIQQDRTEQDVSSRSDNDDNCCVIL